MEMLIYNQDCVRGMKEKLTDSSIDLVITSPPYKEQDGFSWELIREAAQQCYRVLKDDALCYVNFGHLAGCKSRPFRVAMEFERAGFYWIDTIVWVKNHYTPIQGSKRVNNLTEFVFQFAKGKNYVLDRLAVGVPYKDKTNVGRYADKDLRCCGNVWYISYETIQRKSQKPHKDRFPVELPKRCILLSGLRKGSLVLDPFAGSMTTGIACMELGMEFIGFEVDRDVFESGRKRLCSFDELFTADMAVQLHS